MRAVMATDEFPNKELETLWAPWRVEYFEKEPRDRNFLEATARASNDGEHLVITRRENAFLMMNRSPSAGGHLMAVPCGRTGRRSALSASAWLELRNLVVSAQTPVGPVTQARGFHAG